MDDETAKAISDLQNRQDSLATAMRAMNEVLQILVKESQDKVRDVS
tara:strand:- start:187 stop:324 length:138 start_codon:yes stop_codon:yes gene_type:complete